jgi:hypothetical protein
MQKVLMLVLLFGVGSASCATGVVKNAQPESGLERPLAVIDAHTHARFTGGAERFSKIPMTEEQYFSEWKRSGVVGAVAHVGQNGSEHHPRLKAKNVVFCAGASSSPDLKRIEKGLKDGSYGCIKIYLGYVHQYASDPRYQPLYRLARQYKVPVVFHTGDTYSVDGKLKYADPLTIDEVAVDYRDVQFVIAHLGNPWIQSAAEVAYKNPNVAVEVSALLIGNLDEQDPAKVEELVVKPITWAFTYIEDPSKVMFGTDWPLTDIGSYIKAVKRAIPSAHWQAVFHDNAARIFKLK